MRRLRAVIHGDVEGVGFRYFILDAARPAGVTGWVRNRPDGTVELIAEGDRGTLESLLAAARRGPRGARIDRVDVDWQDAAGDLGPFAIVH